MTQRIAAAVLLLIFGATALDAIAQTGRTEGEIRKVDRETGKVTLRHGPIAGALEMPAMSMVFQVKDPALLDRLKQGDRGQAMILKENGVFYIESFEKM